MRVSLTALSLAVLAGCATPDELGPSGDAPSIPLINSAGASTGAVQAEMRPGGTYLRIAVEGLSPGDHGLHLHAVGRCDGPDFKNAGGHWNPEGRQHGHLNPAGQHKGDLPNLTVSASGRGAINFLVSGQPLNDADGTSLVIHAQADDYRTDPSGNSGDRIACAVLAAPVQP
ncbi:MAG TPA: superoxide dismutase family protein [Sphingomicrobium sp.]|nr:superoxide dismutase family protein [Sphingomicrobium sp.]